MYVSQTEKMTSKYNVGMDLFKIMAACMVVFIHAPFPGKFGELVSCIGRIAVPGFFAISGYFSYGANSDQLKKRMGQLIKLNVWGIALTILWGCVATELGGESMAMYNTSSVSYLRGSIPSWRDITCWLVLDINPFNKTFWYLMALLKCYGVMWLFVSFFEEKTPTYQGLYVTGILLFAVNLLLGVMSAVVLEGVDYKLLRNALLLGWPMFTMGLFLGQYWERIWRVFKLNVPKLLVLVVVGVALSWLEKTTLITCDVHIGSVLTVIALFLLMSKYPHFIKKPEYIRLVKKCGKWSVGVYLVHYIVILAVYDFIGNLLMNVIPFWPYVWSLIVLVISIVLAAVNDMAWIVLRQLWKKRAV